MYRNINNYYFNRPNYGYAYANPYGMNFSRSYPRVVIYNGQQNFNIHDAFPDNHRQQMIQDINNPFIQDYLSKLRGHEVPLEVSEAVRFLNPSGKRAVEAALVTDPEFRKKYGNLVMNEDSEDIAAVRAAIQSAKDWRKSGNWKDRARAKAVIRSARPAMDRVNKDMLSYASGELDYLK